MGCALARFISARFVGNAAYGMREEVLTVIDWLKNDEEDIEIKRVFCTEDEIEVWLHEQKRQRDEEKRLEEDERAKRFNAMTAQTPKITDHSSSSSLSSDSDDELQEVSKRLLSIDRTLNNNSLDDVDIYSPPSDDAADED